MGHETSIETGLRVKSEARPRYIWWTKKNQKASIGSSKKKNEKVAGLLGAGGAGLQASTPAVAE
jgi:hypothetical protein